MAVLGLMWILIYQNAELKAELASHNESVLAASLGPPDPVPAVQVVTDGQAPSSLPDLLANGGVLLFLTTTCPYCESSLEAWGKLRSVTEQGGGAFVAVSLHDAVATQEYVDNHGLDWPIWVLGQPEERPLIEITGVPYTLTVGQGAIISGAWGGTFGDERIEDVERVFAQGLASR